MITTCLSKASKNQLLQIALNEECPMSLKYKACRLLQKRTWTDKNKARLITLWAKGYDIKTIAESLEMSDEAVGLQVNKMKLWRGRLNELKKTF